MESGVKDGGHGHRIDQVSEADVSCWSAQHDCQSFFCTWALQRHAQKLNRENMMAHAMHMRLLTLSFDVLTQSRQHILASSACTLHSCL